MPSKKRGRTRAGAVIDGPILMAGGSAVNRVQQRPTLFFFLVVPVVKALSTELTADQDIRTSQDVRAADHVLVEYRGPLEELEASVTTLGGTLDRFHESLALVKVIWSWTIECARSRRALNPVTRTTTKAHRRRFLDRRVTRTNAANLAADSHSGRLERTQGDSRERHPLIRSQQCSATSSPLGGSCP